MSKKAKSPAMSKADQKKAAEAQLHETEVTRNLIKISGVLSFLLTFFWTFEVYFTYNLLDLVTAVRFLVVFLGYWFIFFFAIFGICLAAGWGWLLITLIVVFVLAIYQINVHVG